MSCLLFDISNLAYRSYHAAQASAERFAKEHGEDVRPMQATDGFPTGVLHNSIRTIFRLIEEHKATRAIAVFDHGPCYARTRILPTYKDNRPPRPPELTQQIEDLYEHLPLFGIPVVRLDNTEADDIIHVLAGIAPYERVVIVADDKDMGQSIRNNVYQLKSPGPTGGPWRLCGEPEIEARMGVKTHQVSDFLALTGDSADNIPGLPGVGEVTARKWLAQYGSIDGIIAAADTIEPKRFREVVSANIELLKGYHTITKLHDVNVVMPPLLDPIPEKRDAYLAKRELRSVAAQYFRNPKKAAPAPPAPIVVEKSPEFPSLFRTAVQAMLF